MRQQKSSSGGRGAAKGRSGSPSKRNANSSSSSRGQQSKSKSFSKSKSSNPSGSRNAGPKGARPNKFGSRRPEVKKASNQSSNEVKDGIRLNKYISNAGVCSRREADTYIETGNVKVNDKVVTEMGYRVMPGDSVKFDNTLISPEKKKYVLLNKPKNYITTMEDDRGRKTVMELVEKATKERIYPVGRLDRQTTGLLLFTNDGELAKKLTHPKHNVYKLYHATLDRKLDPKDLAKIGDTDFEVEGRRVFVDDIKYVEGGKKREIGIQIHSGRNRIVRKIFESLGYEVTKLDRVIFAGLTKKNLPRGFYRELTAQELANLQML